MAIKSSNIYLKIDNITNSLTDWATLMEQNVQTVRSRYNKLVEERGSHDKLTDDDIRTILKYNPEKLKTPVQPAVAAATPEGAGTNQTASLLMQTFQNLMLDSLIKVNADNVYDAVLPELKKRFIEEFGGVPVVHKIELPDIKTEIEGALHEKFDEVLKLVRLNIPVFLSGPAGTGKNVICKQVAEALGLDFYFSNAVTQEFKITGYQDANGVYRDTQFFNAFTKGGLFMLDEIDASIPEVLVILNAAIANGYFDFPGHGRIEAHPNFRVIAAGNTFGTGADSEYTGRYSLDKASLDRFAIINIEYSPAIEKAVTNDNTELLEFCREFRGACKKAGINCLFSYRSLSRITLLEQVQPDLSEVLQISLTKGLDKDDLNIITTNLKDVLKENKYFKALKKIKG